MQEIPCSMFHVLNQ